MRGPGRNREQRREDLRAAAATEFARHGYEAATVARIADRLGVTKPAVYRYVSGKEELLEEIVSRVLADGRAIVERHRAAGAPVPERLRGVIVDHVRFFVRDLDATTVYLHEMHRLPDRLRERFDHEGLEYQRSLRDLVDEGRAHGTVRPELDPGLVALQVFGSLTWMYRWYRPDGRLGPDEIADQFADVTLLGMTPRGDDRAVGAPAAVRPSRRAARRPEPATGTPADTRRSEVLDVAASVFAARGFGGASLQEIADRMGMLKGSLYHYIDSKEGLLLEVVRDTHDGGLDILRRHAGASGPVPARLRDLVVDQVIHFVNNPGPSAVYLHELHRAPEAVRRGLSGDGPGRLELLTGLIAGGVADGTVRADVDPGLAALHVLGSLNWMYRWYRPGGRLTATRIGEQIADVGLRGVLPRP